MDSSTNMDTKKNILFAPGDMVRVEIKVKESGKERLQAFEGTVIGIRGSGDSKNIIVRKIAAGGIGVERIWPVHFPAISKIKVLKKRPQKRAKLSYLRKLRGKEATGANL